MSRVHQLIDKTSEIAVTLAISKILADYWQAIDNILIINLGKYSAILHEICRNLVNYKHRINYRYRLLSELKY